MPDENIRTTLQFQADITDFKSAMQEANRAVKLANSEFKAASSGMDDWGSSTDGLAAKLNQLAAVHDAEKRKLDVLQTAYQKTVAEQGAASAAAVDLQTKINNQQAVVNKTQKEYDSYAAKLEEVEKGADEAGAAVKKAGESAEKSTGGWTILKDVVADFVSNFLRQAVEGVRDFVAETITMGKDFDSQMSRVAAISGATGDELAALRDTAKELGASTTFSASQAAEGMENLASAGFEVGEIIAAMPGMLDLAASSGEDLASASDIAASTLRGFGLEADQAAHVADVLAKNAAATNAAVADTGEAMKYIAPVANAAGLSLEEVAASIGILSDAGIKGSQAGTTLRGALSRLAKPTTPMTQLMDELGLSFYNSAGEMKSMEEIIAMLNEKMAGLTEQEQQNALVTLFGQEALSGMTVLMEAGSEKLGKLTESYKSADGAAAKMAKTMTDNLGGDLEALGGNLETVQLTIYEKLEPALRTGVEALNKLVDAVAWVVDHSSEIVSALTVMAVAMGTYVAYTTAIKVMKDGWMALTVVQKAVAAGQAALNAVMALNPIGLIVAAIAGLVAAFVVLWNKSEAFRNFWTGLWDGIKEKVAAVAEWFSETASKIAGWFSDAWGNIKNAWSGAKEWFGDVRKGINEKFEKIGDWFGDKFTKAKDLAQKAWSKTKDYFGNVREGINEKFQKFDSWMGNKFGDAWTETKKKFSLSNVKEYFSNIKEKIHSPFEKVGGWFSDKFSAAYKNITDAFSNAGIDFADVWAGIKSVFKPVDFVSIGGNMISGLWNGIKDGAKWLKDKIVGLAGDIAGWFKDFFGIHSPSTVMRDEVGKMLGLGMAEGITDSRGAVNSAVRKLGDAALGGLSAGGGGDRGVAAGGQINFTQNNYSPVALSRREIYRQTHNALAFAGGGK